MTAKTTYLTPEDLARVLGVPVEAIYERTRHLSEIRAKNNRAEVLRHASVEQPAAEVGGDTPTALSNKRPDEIPLVHRLALSVDEAGALLGISRDLAYDLVASGELPSVRLGRRIVVPRHALEETLRRMVEEDRGQTAAWP